MVSLTEAKTDFNRVYTDIQKDTNASWLRELRREGMDGFQRLGFPTRKTEEYKYTDCRPIQNHPFVLPTRSSGADTSVLERIVPEEALCLVFIDGFFSPHHSHSESMAEWIDFQTISDLLRAGKADTRALRRLDSATVDDPFAGLNQALFRDGVLLRIKPEARLDREIHLVQLFSGAPDIMAFPRNVIQIGESAEVSIVQTSAYAGDTVCYLHNARTDICVLDNAQVSYTQIQLDSPAAYHINNTRMQVARDAQVEVFTLTTGGRLVRNNLALTLAGAGIDVTLNGLQAVRGHQHVDNHTVVDHRYPHSMSSQLYKGILSGQGRTVFNGKIFVQPEAQQTNAYQLNRNLLLSHDAEADTKPQLQIFADDVRCTHGATIGPINETELFYLHSRGINREQGISLLSHGFAEEVLVSIADLALQTRLRDLLGDYFRAIEGADPWL